MFSKFKQNSTTNEVLYVDGQGVDEHLFEISTTTGVKAYKRDHLGSITNSAAIGGKTDMEPTGRILVLLFQQMLSVNLLFVDLLVENMIMKQDSIISELGIMIRRRGDLFRRTQLALEVVIPTSMGT